MLTGRQIRGARKLLRWTHTRLARSASMAQNLIVAIESVDGAAWLNEGQEAALRRAFGAAGVEFMAANDGTVGVRLRKAES